MLTHQGSTSPLHKSNLDWRVATPQGLNGCGVWDVECVCAYEDPPLKTAHPLPIYGLVPVTESIGTPGFTMQATLKSVR